jgi:CubicO group peptidase (beta-lactamase class C family)
MNRYIYVVLAAWLATPASSATQSDTEARIQRIQRGLVPPVLVQGETPAMQPLAARMAELKVPGVSIAVIHQGRIEWARGFGVTGTQGPPVTQHTLFQAASISNRSSRTWVP